jgi:NAD(P)-dependent dehydrogenase (short-subunit alcohol dehydrogenase family)
MRLAGKVALVTGGGSGIGRGIAIRFAEEGADVAVADLNRAGAETTAEEIGQFRRRSLVIEADVRSRDDCERMVQETVAAFDRLDCFVANAGIGRGAPFLEMLEEVWDAVLRTNLTGVFLSCQAAARRMWSRATAAGSSRSPPSRRTGPRRGWRTTPSRRPAWRCSPR